MEESLLVLRLCLHARKTAGSVFVELLQCLAKISHVLRLWLHIVDGAENQGYLANKLGSDNAVRTHTILS
jgi:hypothetical protein